MYRVSRKGIVMFEARDGLLVRLSMRLGITAAYEVSAVMGNEGKYGGVDATGVPNFAYRLTERQLVKTINSYNPTGRHRFRFYYQFNPPAKRPSLARSARQRLAITLIAPTVWLITRLFKRQCNTFGAVILKPAIPDDLWPWLKLTDGRIEFNPDFVRSKRH
ncbi:MAG: hypothetical protein B1H04_04665 [Planctomycetales bacterium 4484_123]|nr:MAG: hypothetical protein B1H04_04665 [Planctomycetales bacterium 4484_123]